MVDLRAKFVDVFGFDYRDRPKRFEFDEEIEQAKARQNSLSQPRSRSNKGTASRAELSPNCSLKRGYGKQYRKEVSRLRAERLNTPENREKARRGLDIYWYIKRRDKHVERSIQDAALLLHGGRVKKGRKEGGTGNSYRINGKEVQRRIDSGILWNANRRAEEWNSGIKSTSRLPAPSIPVLRGISYTPDGPDRWMGLARTEFFRSESEATFYRYTMEVLNLPCDTIRYTERDKELLDEVYVDFNGILQPHTPDFAIFLNDEARYLELEATDHRERLYSAFKNENFDLYKKVRLQILNTLQRSFCNSMRLDYATPGETIPISFLANATVKKWEKNDPFHINSKRVETQLARTIDRKSNNYWIYLTNLLDLFPEEAGLLLKLMEVFEGRIDPSRTYSPGEILDLIRESLAEAAILVDYDDREVTLLNRFRRRKYDRNYNVYSVPAYRP